MSHYRVVRLAGALLAACTMAACTTNVSAYRASPAPAPGGFRVGVGRTDITPTPCYPTGGHGPAGAVAQGHWTRLYAKAFFFQDGDGHQLVLVTTDLWALPAGLHAGVSYQLHRAGRPIAPQEIVIAASHTHQGPGNYMSARGYNQFGATYPGFRRELYEFLEDRIALAIHTAIDDAEKNAGKPFALRWRVGRADETASGDLDSFVLNRMPEAVLRNPERDDLMDSLDPPTLPAYPTDCRDLRLCADPDGNPVPASVGGSVCEAEEGWDLRGCPRLRMADQTLQVLEIERDGKTIGLLVFFPIHPTALKPTAPLFSSDLTGIAMRRLEAARSGDGTIAGFFNGAEGDIVPRRLRRDVKDVERLGNTFAQRVERVLSSATLEEFGDVSIRVQQTTITNKLPVPEECPGLPLASLPKFGAAAFGGAEGDRTILYDLGFREGMRAQPDHGQGPKLPALDSPIVRFLKFTRSAAPPEAFPSGLPVTVAELGPLVVATVPVEMTTAMGNRIYEQGGLDRSRLAFIGLADEYASYNTTPEEYLGQEYEGASTIWGPRQGPRIACEIARLKKQTQDFDRDIPSQEFYVGATTRKFGPRFCGDAREHPDELLEEILLEETGRPARSLPWYAWEEDSTRTPFDRIAQRTVSVLENTGTGWIVRTTDADTELITTLLDPRSKESKKQVWAALWITSVLNDPAPPAGEYQIRVTWTGGSRKLCSEIFRLDSITGRGPRATADCKL